MLGLYCVSNHASTTTTVQPNVQVLIRELLKAFEEAAVSMGVDSDTCGVLLAVWLHPLLPFFVCCKLSRP